MRRKAVRHLNHITERFSLPGAETDRRYQYRDTGLDG